MPDFGLIACAPEYAAMAEAMRKWQGADRRRIKREMKKAAKAAKREHPSPPIGGIDRALNLWWKA